MKKQIDDEKNEKIDITKKLSENIEIVEKKLDIKNEELINQISQSTKLYLMIENQKKEIDNLKNYKFE